MAPASMPAPTATSRRPTPLRPTASSATSPRSADNPVLASARGAGGRRPTQERWWGVRSPEGFGVDRLEVRRRLAALPAATDRPTGGAHQIGAAVLERNAAQERDLCAVRGGDGDRGGVAADEPLVHVERDDVAVHRRH